MAELKRRGGAATRPVSRGRMILAVGLLLGAAAGCGGGLGAANGDDPPVTAPDDLAPADDRVLDPAPKNYNGQPILLDETGLLACAKNQIAWVMLRDGNQADAASANDELAVASARAAESSVTAISTLAAGLLDAANGQSALQRTQAFLNVCTSLGFEY